MEYVPDNYDLWVEWDAEQEEDKDETQSTCTNI